MTDQDREFIRAIFLVYLRAYQGKGVNFYPDDIAILVHNAVITMEAFNTGLAEHEK